MHAIQPRMKNTTAIKCMAGLLCGILLAQLAACGWRLRGNYDFPKSMERVYVQGTARYSALGNAIHNAFQGTNAQLVANLDQATAILVILSDKSAQRILATDSSGRASEYEISYQLTFKLTDAKDSVLVADQQISLKREYRFDPNNVLATGGEVDRLTHDMLREAVQQMLRRINAAALSDNLAGPGN